MSHPLLPLLDILTHPQHPAFAQAAQRLGTVLDNFDPATLTPPELALLQTRLTTALSNIRSAQALTESELGLTQTRARALQSYSRLT